MTDEQMQLLLEAWFKDTDPTPPDSRQTAVRMMARVPQTRQRGRWWPLPRFRRPPVSAFRGQDSAPAPIPATNVRARTRGFTMFSGVKSIAAAAIVALFGGLLLTGVLTTRQVDEPIPAAAMATVDPHPVTGRALIGAFHQHAETTWDAGRQVELRRGEVWFDTLTMDDPRLSGTLWQAQNRDTIGGPLRRGLGEVETGTVALVNEEGSWVGTMRGYASMGPRTHYWHFELTGTGAHDGLSAILSARGPAGGPWDIEGFVFPGVLPEYPDPVEVPVQ